MTYRVYGTAHSTLFDERGFATSAEAEAFASSVIDGDLDSDVEVLAESVPLASVAVAPRDEHGEVPGLLF